MTPLSALASWGKYEFKQTMLTPKETFAMTVKRELTAQMREEEGTAKNNIVATEPNAANNSNIDFLRRAVHSRKG